MKLKKEFQEEISDPINQLEIARASPPLDQRSLVLGEIKIVKIAKIGTKLKIISSLHQVGIDNPLRIPRCKMRITKAELRIIG